MSRHRQNRPDSPKPEAAGPSGPATIRTSGRSSASSEPPRPRAVESAPNQAAGRTNAPQPELDVVKASDVGRLRPHNEDFADYYVPVDPEQLQRKGALYLVADGMGGHQAGEVASQNAVGAVIREYYADPNSDVGTSLVRAFRLANQQIHEQAQADQTKVGMGTTLVAAVILGPKVYIANVGDSRAYLIGQKGITQITEDHSWVEEQVRAGLLTADQARRHPQRNLVTRALGTKPAVEVDLFEGQMGPGDRLLLCSDGLTNHVEPVELEAVTRENSPQQAAEILISRANERGGSDNITVLIVGGQKLTVPPPAAVKAGPKVPLLPVAAGLVVLLALVAAAILLLSGALRPEAGRTATATDEATATGPAATEAETPSPEQTATLDIGASAPPSVATLAPSAGLVVPTAETSSAGGSTPAGLATATLVPTVVITMTATPGSPQPTATVASAPVAVPATQTPRPSYPRPVLQAPDSGSSVHGRVTFRWSYARSLGSSEGFEVLIWPEGQAHLGAAELTTAREQAIDLDVLFEGRGWRAGEYLWSVVVRQRGTSRALSSEAVPWRVNYAGRDQPSGPGWPPILPPTATSLFDG
jgi:serine/threonine protein phosphatase PrpC